MKHPLLWAAFFWLFLPMMNAQNILSFEPSPSFKKQGILQDQFTDYRIVRLNEAQKNALLSSDGNALNFSLVLPGMAHQQLSLYSKEMRASNFRLVTEENGKQVTLPVPARSPVFTSENAILTLDEQFILLTWTAANGKEYVLEPLWRFVDGADRQLYICYAAADVIIPANACGTDMHIHVDEDAHDNDAPKPSGPEKVGECLEVEIALAADFELFQDFGNNATSVNNFMLGVLANVQTNYDTEFLDEVRFVVATTFIATTNASDPWTNNTDAGLLLDNFTAWGQGGGFGATYDVASLWSGRAFDGGTIGVAWLSGVCTSLRYNVLENFSSNAQTLRVLWAHELGHNFSAVHDAANSNTIMAPSVNTSNAWSNASLNSINGFLPGANCLDNCPAAGPPTAFIEALYETGCTGSFLAFFDESEGLVSSRMWDFGPEATPSTSLSRHPVVQFNAPGTYQVSLEVCNADGCDFTTFDVFIEDGGNGTAKVLHAETFENGFGQWSVNNPDNNFTWELISVGGIPGSQSAYVNNYDYNANGQVDALRSPVFDFTEESGMNLHIEYAYIRYQTTTDRLRVRLSTNGGSTFPITLFEGVENGSGNFATGPASNSAFFPSTANDWCINGPSCLDLDLSAYAGQSQIVISIENITAFGNNMFVDNIYLTADCAALEAPIANFSQDLEIGCAPLEVGFTDLSTGTVDFYDWSFPGGSPSFSNDPNPFVTYFDPGVYDVSLTVENFAGSDFFEITGAVTVLGVPTADFSFTNTDATFNFMELASPDVTLYEWDFGDGATSNQANPTHTYTSGGDFLVTLTVYNDCGSETFSAPVTVEALLVADFNADVTVGCAPLEVQFFEQTIGNPDTWDWTFAGGSPASSSLQNPVVTYNMPGIFDVTLEISNATENTQLTFEDYITVLPQPTAGFSVSSTPGDDTAQFSNTSADATAYSWDFGDGASSSAASPSHTYAAAGTYTVTLTASNECGESTATQMVTIVLPVTPSFTASVTDGCTPMSVDFTASPQAVGLLYAWAFPGGSPSTSSDANPSIVYNLPGSYEVSLTITNEAGDATTAITDYITVGQAPDAAFTLNYTPGSLEIGISNQSTDADALSWDFGDGTSQNGNVTTYSFAEEGVYTVTLTATNSCGQDVTTQEVAIVLPVQPSFSSSVASGCAPLSVAFEAAPQSEGLTYSWTFAGGAPATSSVPNPTVVYGSPGTYPVSLSITNAAGTVTTSMNDVVVVNADPTASFTAQYSPGSGNVVLDNTSEGASSYSWDFGDGASANTANPSHTYTAQGSYTIMLTATNECGTSTSTQVVDVVLPPSATFNANVSAGCSPLSVNFEAATCIAGNQYNWSLPGATPDTLSGACLAAVTYATPGTYQATLYVTNASGTVSAQLAAPITVSATPEADFTTDYSPGVTTASFSATVAADTYNWRFGDGTSAQGSSVSHTFSADGTYEIILDITSSCGTASDTSLLTIVTPVSSAFIAVNATGCAPFSTQFIPEEQDASLQYAWTFPGGTPAQSSEMMPTVSYAMPGNYSATLTITNAGGSTTTEQLNLVVVAGSASAAFVTGNEIGSGEVSFEAANGNASEWSWNYGDGSTGSGQLANHTYAASGTYQVTLVASNACGSSTITQNVVVVLPPVASFTASTSSICAGEMITFAVTPPEDGVTYSWSFEGGSPATSAANSVEVVFMMPGNYAVQLMATNAAGSTSSVQMIVVNSAPSVSISSVVNGLTVNFQATATGADSYTWDFGDGSTGAGEQTMHTYATVGTYNVTIVATNNCGETPGSAEVVLQGQAPTVSFNSDVREGCGPLRVAFSNASVNATSWEWMFPGGNPATSTDEHPVVTYETPGYYQVSLVASNVYGANALTRSQWIQVFAPTTADYSWMLDEATAQFSNSSANATSYTWIFSNGQTIDDENPSFTFPGNGEYEVLLVADGACNADTSAQTILVNGELPTLSLDGVMTTGCNPFTLSLNFDEVNATAWAWTFEGANPGSANVANPSVVYQNAGTYTISLLVSNAFGTTEYEWENQVVVDAAPLAPEVQITAISATGLDYTFTAASASPSVTYTWDFGDGSTGTGENPTHAYAAAGNYVVIVTATNQCGSTQSVIEVEVIVSTDNAVWESSLQLYPNPAIEQISLKANNWPWAGQLQYQLSNPLGQTITKGIWYTSTGNWNNTLDLSTLPAGSYFLQVQFDGELATYKVVKM